MLSKEVRQQQGWHGGGGGLKTKPARFSQQGVDSRGMVTAVLGGNYSRSHWRCCQRRCPDSTSLTAAGLDSRAAGRPHLHMAGSTGQQG